MSKPGMLVLNRDVDETIVIRVGEIRIDVVLVRSTWNKARLGFLAPPEVQINRLEVDESKQAEAREKKAKKA